MSTKIQTPSSPRLILGVLLVIGCAGDDGASPASGTETSGSPGPTTGNSSLGGTAGHSSSDGDPSSGDTGAATDSTGGPAEDSSTGESVDNPHQFEGYLANVVPSACVDAAKDASFLYPFDTEAGWFNAARLSSDAGDVMIDQIEYVIVDATFGPNAVAQGCGLLDHRVRVFVGDAAPPEAPRYVFEQEIIGLDPADFADGEPVTITVDVPPIAVAEGQSIYVMFETPVQDGLRICALSCEGSDVEADRSLQTGAAAPPYPWLTQASFGIPDTFAIWAHIAE